MDNFFSKILYLLLVFINPLLREAVCNIIIEARVLVPTTSAIAMRIREARGHHRPTMIAFCTSLPKLLIGITAVRKGHPEVMICNVVGADVLNCLFVVGAAATTRPLTVHQPFFSLHFPAMLLILYYPQVFIGLNWDGAVQALAERMAGVHLHHHEVRSDVLEAT